MKKLLFLLVLLLGVSQNVAAVSKVRAIKCSLPKLHQKFNCTPQERAVGKRWLAGATIATVAAAIAAIIGGISAAEIKKAKAEAESPGALRNPPTLQAMDEKYGLSKAPGMWDRTLFDVVKRWYNDWEVGVTIAKVENDLTHVTPGALEAAIEVAEYWQKSPSKDVSSDLVLQLKNILSKKLKQVEDAPRSAPKPKLTPPPPLVTPDMKPNPVEKLPPLKFSKETVSEET
jgi:hypothetical protein